MRSRSMLLPSYEPNRMQAFTLQESSIKRKSPLLRISLLLLLGFLPFALAAGCATVPPAPVMRQCPLFPVDASTMADIPAPQLTAEDLRFLKGLSPGSQLTQPTIPLVTPN